MERTPFYRDNMTNYILRKQYDDYGDRMKLHELANGQCATIIQINVSNTRKKRLFYLGIYEGNTITRLQCAPLHDPVLYWVNATQLVLRNSDASCIEVEVKTCTQSPL